MLKTTNSIPIGSEDTGFPMGIDAWMRSFEQHLISSGTNLVDGRAPLAPTTVH